MWVCNKSNILFVKCESDDCFVDLEENRMKRWNGLMLRFLAFVICALILTAFVDLLKF